MPAAAAAIRLSPGRTAPGHLTAAPGVFSSWASARVNTQVRLVRALIGRILGGAALRKPNKALGTHVLLPTDYLAVPSNKQENTPRSAKVDCSRQLRRLSACLKTSCTRFERLECFTVVLFGVTFERSCSPGIPSRCCGPGFRFAGVF